MILLTPRMHLYKARQGPFNYSSGQLKLCWLSCPQCAWVRLLNSTLWFMLHCCCVFFPPEALTDRGDLLSPACTGWTRIHASDQAACRQLLLGWGLLPCKETKIRLLDIAASFRAELWVHWEQNSRPTLLQRNFWPLTMKQLPGTNRDSSQRSRQALKS